MNKGLLMYSFYIALSLGCSSYTPPRQVDIKWKKIFNTEAPVDFCQIDSIQDAYIFSYSHSAAISGGFKVLKLVREDHDSLISNVLFENAHHTIHYLNIRDNNIGFVRYDHDQKVVNSSLLLSRNMGAEWDTINVPLDIRRFLFTDSFITIEGSRDGNLESYKSGNIQYNWIKINTFKKGWKSFYLLGNSGSENKILCDGSKSFNQKNNQLLLFDVVSESTKELTNLYGSGSYLKPISTNNNLHGIQDGRKISIYSLSTDELHLENKFKLPQEADIVQNLYLGDTFYIITTDTYELMDKPVSWISYDKGDHWLPFFQDQRLQLIYSSFGGLLMTDKDNNVLLAE